MAAVYDIAAVLLANLTSNTTAMANNNIAVFMEFLPILNNADIAVSAQPLSWRLYKLNLTLNYVIVMIHVMISFFLIT